MTLLDISKLKDKGVAKDSSGALASSQVQQSAQAQAPKPQPVEQAQAQVQKPVQPQAESLDLIKLKTLLSEANDIYRIDLHEAETKYDEIKNIYSSLSQEEKSKVYDDCLKLFNLLSSN